ncbi:hypothetical protein NP493_1332g00041 [Ridgeia piscesae]|uniref:VWFA domain-containing protein n=1 Tax=Ridgeia piscesae TaxID=27915 RepID=A0AAD9K821_RIDPI|nr:hypothetical protein NP493_1332g00041 [Ridgeia piscesae]
MTFLYQAAVLLLAVAVERSAACDMFTLGDCSAKCGGGFATGPLKCSDNGTESVCGKLSVTCNSAPCDGPEPWSDCSASCGGGSKTRSVGNETQTLPCNTQNCDSADCPDSAADIVFVLDNSNSITNFGFEAAKQIVSDAVSGLPSGVRVSMIEFSTKTNVVFELTKSPSAAAILAPSFTGGSGILAYGVLAAAAALSSSAAGVPKIVVFVSDGEQMVLEACANELATAIRDSGVTMLSVVIGRAAPSALYPVTSPEFNKNQFLSSDVYAARKISAAIRGALANCTAAAASEDGEAELDDAGLKGGPMMSAGVAQSNCGPWGEWSACSESCGVSGIHERVMICVDESREEIKKFQFQACMIICPEPEVVCSMNDYMHGHVWLAHPGNCHLYFVCELVYRNKFRMHGIDCGELFWNDDTLLCETAPDADATCDLVVNVPQQPKPFTSKCSSPGLVLEYDFDTGVVDNCNGAPLVTIMGSPNIAPEGPNNVLCFDGSSYMQIPFLTTWFAGKTVTEFTVALWYKRCSDDTRDEQGLIHNGGCAAVNTGFQVTTGYGGVFAGVTTSDPYPPGLKQLFAVTAPSSDWLEKAGWQQAVMVFDGENEKLYLQGYERERAPSEGCMLNGPSPAFLGKLCEGKFFCGCIDNLRVWERALSAGEVLSLQ